MAIPLSIRRKLAYTGVAESFDKLLTEKTHSPALDAANEVSDLAKKTSFWRPAKADGEYTWGPVKETTYEIEPYADNSHWVPANPFAECVEAAPAIEPRAEPSVAFTPKAIKHVPRLLISDFVIKPIFYMGVEFEGMVTEEAYPLIKRAMYDLAQDENGESLIQFGVDSSVKNVPPGYTPIEIRTSVARSRVGLKLFEEMLCFLYLASQTGDWLTNETCGLHINISEEGVFDRVEQVDYYCHVLSHFDELAVLEIFGRIDNRYCHPFFKDLAARSFDETKRLYQNLKRRERAAADRGDVKWKVNEGKYLAVSLRDSPVHDGYEGDEQTAQRIEFRCIGNTDYHLRFDELNESINHMISCVRLAYREVTK